MTVIFHVSDVHFGTEDRAALAWFAAQVAEQRPDLVLVTGDVTAAARPREFAAAGDWLTALGAPVRIEPGNHDLPVFSPFLRLADPYRRMQRLLARFDRPADLPGVTLASLKTTARLQWRADWSLGHIGRGSLDATLAQLGSAPPGSLRLVACHHPLIDVGTRTPGATRGGATALAALRAAGVAAVLTGHTHDPFDVDHEGVRLIGAGTLSMRVRAMPPSYNRLAVEDGKLQTTPIFAGEPRAAGS